MLKILSILLIKDNDGIATQELSMFSNILEEVAKFYHRLIANIMV